MKELSQKQQDLEEKEELSGAQIFLECLKKENVKEIFGYPGGVILTIYEALYNCPDIKHYLVRHEQAAIHAAEGYARVTGKPGVVTPLQELQTHIMTDIRLLCSQDRSV